jgi:pimeloyl-ACP methyl ester carboxylesterase
MFLAKALKLLLLVALIAGAGSATADPPPAGPIAGVAEGQDGIRLHYLDFGGRGEPVLLLTGPGNTAWIYTEFGARLARHYHVLALTRRGHGESDMPEQGYDQQTLAEDLRRFLDQRGISRVHLVGHSAAGAEMTRFAGTYPERVASLTYLDAAYDRSTQGPIEAGNPERPDPPTSADRSSIDSFVAYLFRARPIYALYPRAVVERDTRAALTIRPDGSVGFRMGQSQFEQFVSSFSAAPPDYSRVRAPALAIYAGGQSAFRLRTATPELRPRLGRFLTETVEPWRQASIAQFRRALPHAEVVSMDAVHHPFLHKPAETAALVRRFLARHPIR